MRKILPSCLLISTTSLMLVAQSAAAQSDSDLKVGDCVRVLRSDSVHMFFDKDYALTPPDCADIRRETRMDAEGNFAGEVRDYLTTGNILLTKIHYANGLRDGSYERSYGTGQPAVNGQFAQGQPVGTWYYWYANGRPWQTLELTANAPLRILAFADSTGRVLVSNGAGIWQENTSRPIAAYSSGRVVNGLMDGTWERRGAADKQLMTSEDYRQGRLEAGRHYVGMVSKPKKYTDQRLLGPQAVDASAASEPFHFGMTCGMQASLRRSKSQDAAIAAATKFPYAPIESSAYQHEILRRLAAFNNSAQWMPRTDGQVITVTADIDAAGGLSNFASETAVLASTLAAITSSLGTWRPAMVGQVAVPGKLRFTLRMHSTQLNSSLVAYPAYPLPAAATQQFRK